jgi:Sulfotransferase family
MHRSGTSMLGRLLENLGLFAGTKKDVNNEAIFFQNINVWLLRQSGARWDTPDAIEYLWRIDEALPLIERHIRNLLNSPKAVQFLGLRGFLKGGMAALDSPWGWKDPRNTFTLPMWLRIFPDAKVISIERHGVDVAESLRARELSELKGTAERYDRVPALSFLRQSEDGFVGSPRCASLDGGFSLWSAYVNQARKMLEALPSDRVLALRYEDVLADPETHLRSSAKFCGLDVPDEKLRKVVASIRPDRARSYLSNAELRKFALDHQAELGRFGYND